MINFDHRCTITIADSTPTLIRVKLISNLQNKKQHYINKNKILKKQKIPDKEDI